jgi:hypothetical protein
MSSSLEHANNMNRTETYRLYMKLLPYSMYDNPCKQYHRKNKIKRQQSNEGMIIISTYNVPSSNIAANTGGVGGGVKLRKKMKITSDSVDGGGADPVSPKHVGALITTDEETPTNVIILKPAEYEKMKTAKYSLADLKELCSYYGIKKSGTKPDLTQRIHTFLKQTFFIRRIQRSFKTFLSKKYREYCGPGYLHTSKCVNDTDFYTFDKLSNIKPMELFTYLDTDNKIYGFHIASLFHLIISSFPTITNPYNRNIIPGSVIKKLYDKLIYGSLLGFRVSVKLDEDDNNSDKDDELTNIIPAGLSREKQEELFIVDLFQHINTLGNYSDSEWFITLQRDELIRFIRNVHDIWYYRANLSQEMKERICPPNGNPFVLHNSHVNLNVITLLTTSEIRTICVSVIERMTRRGVSREDQCLGAFYVLATLTIVNQNARNALPWLYEAVV